MCYKTGKTERFLDCAFGSARNDRICAYCVRKNLSDVAILIFMPEFPYPCHPRNPWLMR
jgi:hypothetical protein